MTRWWWSPPGSTATASPWSPGPWRGCTPAGTETTPNLVRALLNIPRRYNGELEELDRLEAQGKVFVIRPPQPVTVSRTEKDVTKLRALYAQGRQTLQGQMDRLLGYLGEGSL